MKNIKFSEPSMKNIKAPKMKHKKKMTQNIGIQDL